MEKVQNENNKNVNVIIIYISEAHAKDEWPISHLNTTNQHKNIKERISAAKRIIKDKSGNFRFNNLAVYCDSFENENFESKFSAWPERASVLIKGK